LRDLYQAGTDPGDADSVLRLEDMAWDQGVTFKFQPVSRVTYSVQSKDRFSDSVWLKVLDEVAASSNRTIRVTDPAGPSRRNYRLRAPREP
jgi:hypothetical protein